MDFIESKMISEHSRIVSDNKDAKNDQDLYRSQDNGIVLATKDQDHCQSGVNGVTKNQEICMSPVNMVTKSQDACLSPVNVVTKGSQDKCLSPVDTVKHCRFLSSSVTVHTVGPDLSCYGFEDCLQ